MRESRQAFRSRASGMMLMLLLLIGMGCGNGRQGEAVQNLNASTHFAKDNLLTYAVDQKGGVYAVSCYVDEENGENSYYCLTHYDEQAVELSDYRFPTEYSGVDAVAVQGETVYFTADSLEDGFVCKALYSFDGNSDQITKQAVFTYFEGVAQLIAGEERIYILGNRQYSMDTDSGFGQQGDYAFKGEQLVYYDLSNGEIYQLGYEKPISISAGKEESIYVNCYMSGTGYCMTEYLPGQESVQILANFENYKFDRFALSGDAKSVIYSYSTNTRGLVLSPLTNLDEEAELYQDIRNVDAQIYCVDNHVYMMDSKCDIVRFSLEDVRKENKTIRYIEVGFQSDAPYGCGYAMERTAMEEDRFTMKVLAQDSDFDLCLVDTMGQGSYNLRKNGSFYPLNSVPGVEEYLSRCFPYVREAATREDGTIWMLPISVSIPGLVADEEQLTELGLHFSQNMTYEQFFEEFGRLSPEEIGQTSLNMTLLQMSFFAQYFAQYQSVQTEQFRSHIELLTQYHSSIPEVVNLVDGLSYAYMRSPQDYMLAAAQTAERQLQVYGMPKLEADTPEMGYCIFLAVNPSSSRLKETLDYLSAWIAYEMSLDEQPLFFERDVTEAALYEKSLYELYKRGEISFTLEQDTYTEGLDDVIYHGADLEQYLNGVESRLNMYFNE